MKNGRPAILKLFLLFSLFIFNFSFVLAQDGDTRFIQRITWNKDEYARRYEVIIEKEEHGTYSELRRETTNESFIETPLLPGNYRCVVIPYNFLNQPGEASEWRYIEVRAALNPELDDILPQFILSRTVTGSGGALYEMRVTGKNLIPGAEIFLRGGDGTRIIPSRTQHGGNGANVRLYFEKNLLAEGNYELVVINPGGLQTGKSGIPFPSPESAQSADKQKKLDMFFGAAWMPSFTIYDEGDAFGRNMSLAGVAGRFGMVMARNFFNFNVGAELAASYNFYGAGNDGLHLWGIVINMLAQMRLPGDRMALAFRLGAGYSLRFYVNMGGSFLLYVMDQRNPLRLYLETGLDYAHWFTTPPYGFFRPWVGVGVCK